MKIDQGLLNTFCFPGDMMLSLVSRGHWRDSAGGNGSSLVLVISDLSIRFLEQMLENCSLRAKSSLLPVFKWPVGTTQVDQQFELQRARQNVPTSTSSSTARRAYASLAWGCLTTALDLYLSLLTGSSILQPAAQIDMTQLSER